MGKKSKGDFWDRLEQQNSAQATADVLDALARKRRRIIAPGPEGKSAAKAVTGLEATVKWQAGSIIDGLPGEVRRRLSPDRLVVKAMPSVYLNAVTVRARDGSYVVVMNVGLMMFLYKFARAVTAQLGSGGSTAPVPLETTVVRVAGLLDWATSPAMTPRSADWPIPRDAVQAAEHCAQFAERYALCHEFAHILGEHFTEGRNRFLAVDGIGIPAVETTAQREFEADMVGLDLLMRSAVDDGPTLRRCYLGCELFLSALVLYESILGPAEGYPPASSRLDLVRQHVDRAAPAGLRAIADHYGTVITALLQQVPEVVRSQRAMVGMHTQFYFNRHATEGDERRSQREFFEWGERFMRRSPGAVLGVIERELRNARVDSSGAITREGLRRWNLAHSFANNLPADLRTAMLPWQPERTGRPPRATPG